MKYILSLCLFLLSYSLQAQTYCTPTFNSCIFNNYISFVSVGGINNTTTGCAVWDYTAQVGNLTVGTPNPMTVTVAGWDGIAIFIDLNNDGDMTDAGELMYNNYNAAGPPITYNFDITIPPGTISGNHRMRVMCGNGGSVSGSPDPCKQNVPYGNYHDYTVNIPPSGANDIGIASIDSPDVFCPGVHNVVVTLGNFGTNVVNSATIHWSVDGVSQPNVNFTGTLDTAGGAGSATASVVLGSYNFATNNPYTVAAWTSNPNGVTDTITGNDSTIVPIQSNLPAPSNIQITALQGNQATFTWSGGSANSWLWSVVPDGTPVSLPGTAASTTTATATGLSSETDYDFYVREVCPTGDTSAWASSVSFKTPFLCPPNSYCFLTGGNSGRNGPSQAQLNTAYSGTNLQGQVTTTNGVQQWTVPAGGLYQIEAFGAQGGGSSTRPGGRGARMRGEFFLNGGVNLNIIVGQTGNITSGNSPSGNRGGGGGSFVWDASNTSQPLIAAGGGGGTNVSVSTAGLGQDGTVANAGTPRAGGGGSPGTSGNGASPGGAGFLTNSSNENSGGSALSALNGGVGADGYTASSHFGGFGGGGGGGGSPSTTYASGGGGGYSGGAGQGTPASQGGGGGGSYNGGMNPDNSSGVRTDDGVVIITILSGGAPHDLGVVSIDSPTIFCPGMHDVVVTVNNFGSEQVTTANIDWTVNGVLQTQYNFSGLLDTVGGSGSGSAQINLGPYNFATNNPYDIKVWTSLPNGMPDTLNQNDTSDITVQSSLPAPTNLNLDSVNPTAAGFSWSGGANNSWLWIVVPAGTPPTGTGNAVNVQNVYVTGLSQPTAYEFYVREVCPTGDTSSWSGPIAFQTPCIPYTPPFFEDFGTTTGVLPICWNTNNASAVFVSAGCAGANGSYLEVEGVPGAYAETPTILFGGVASVRLSYNMRAGDNSCGETPDNGDSSAVEYYDGTNWIRIASYNGGGNTPQSWFSETFTITTGLTNDFKLRVICPAGSGATFDTYHFDDFNVLPSPDNDMAMDSITGISTDCGLTNNESFIAVVTNAGQLDQNNFDIEYSLNGGPWLLGTTVTGNHLAGTTQTYQVSGVDLSTPGNYNIVARVNLASDQDTNNNTGQSVFVQHLAVPDISSVTEDEVCISGPLTLSVVSSANVVDWFDDPALTNKVHTGLVYNIPNATVTTNYYVLGTNANGCETPPVQVKGTVSQPASVDFSYVVMTGLSVDFTEAITGARDSLMWYFGDGDSSSIDNPTHVYAASGTYLVGLEAYTGSCVGDTSLPIFVLNIGLEDRAFSGSIRVFPNPSEGAFMMEIPGEGEELNIEVIGVDGRSHYSEQINNASGTVSKEMDLRHLAAGNYMIRINRDEKLALKRITLK